MAKIINLGARLAQRKEYEFAAKSTLLKDENGQPRLFFFIVLRHIQTKETICYTRLERFVIDRGGGRSLVNESTERMAMSNVVSFLNFVLHDTTKNQIHDIGQNEIRQFLINSKSRPDGKEMKSSSWGKKKHAVLLFLENYYKHNFNILSFRYAGDELSETVLVKRRDGYSSRKILVKNYKGFSVKAPIANDHKHRSRVIMYGHLETLLFVARLYNPMLYLAIALQAFAGLREGEVTNLSISDIDMRERLGMLEGFFIHLNKSDSNRFRRGKSQSGVIKKTREAQQVYPCFNEKVKQAYLLHLDLLKSKGLPTSGNSPLFYNKWNKPMSVTTYSSHLRTLFKGNFIEALQKTSLGTEFEGETQAYIESYQQEYPGAHMFRHWFTMFLITKENLKPEMVRRWRGDSPNSLAYEEYLHINGDYINQYRETAYFFQRQLLGDIDER